MDFEKAFDKIDRAYLWQKLLEQKIKGKVLSVMKSIYDKAKSCVLIDGEYSDYFGMSVGVRQGENLSPSLFALFLNDLKEYLKNSMNGLGTIIEESVKCNMCMYDVDVFLQLFVLLYADDTVVFSENANNLQAGLSKMKLYCDRWNLRLNEKKCKIVIFARGKVRKYPTFTIGNEPVEVVCSFSYLGLKLNYNNQMHVARKDLYDRGSRAMFGLLKRCNTLNLPIDISLDLFDKTITPILTYGCEVWGFGCIDVVQKLQLKFIKTILKLKSSTPSFMIFGETGIIPIQTLVKIRMLTFWYKLILDHNRFKISSVIYTLLHRLYNTGTHKSAYLRFIEHSLVELGVPGLWHTHVSEISLPSFKAFVKQGFKDIFIQEWHSHLNNDQVYTNYRMFKTSFLQEPYIKLLPTNCAIQMLRFRTTNNPLPVNVLRYEGIPRHDRLCNKCNLNDVGDEYHYILICPFFKQKRRELLPKQLTVRPNAMKFYTLLNSNEKLFLLRLKHFLDIINKELK